MEQKIGELEATLKCRDLSMKRVIPQRFTSWSPTYAMHYHFLDAVHTRRLTRRIADLYDTASCNLLTRYVAPWLLNPRASKHEKIRIAFVSRHLKYDHSLGQHIRGIIEGISRERFHVIMVHVIAAGSGESTRFCRSHIQVMKYIQSPQGLTECMILLKQLEGLKPILLSIPK